MVRDFSYDISMDIQKRWSPRAFSGESVKLEVMALLEAARYAPSCFNEQPWRFVVASESEELTVMRSILNESNQIWANAAPVLIAVLAKQTFTQNGKPNFWHVFDTGTAWGYLSLEAQRRGLISHAMAGFDKDKARVVLQVPDDYAVVTMVAVGKMGKKEDLPPMLQEKEEPASRKPLSEIVFNGVFGQKM
jgi:nitroreductase